MGWSEHDTATSIPERFDRQARLAPERAAIAGTEHALTYRELAGLADRYAHALSAPGAGVERVALLMGHDGPLLAAALGALKLGMAVVTLNPRDPAARLEQIRAVAQPDLLVTEAPYRDQARTAGFAGAQTIDLGSVATEPDATAPRPVLEPDRLAFLICTSGSSGLPKVVMQSHRNTLHNVLRYTNGLGIRDDDRVAWLASLSGGQGLATAWTALLNGAALCPFPIAERGVTGLADWLVDNGVTVFDTIPSVLRNFGRTLQDERVPGVRLVRIASEGARRSDFDVYARHFPADCTLANVFASSEAGVIAQGLFATDDDPPPGPLSVGTPADGLEVRIVDERGSPAPGGRLGEVVLRGRYLSPGYWRDPALTEERFETADGSRRFRTGDLGLISPSGSLTIVGRADRQVKIRGHRLHLEEIEAALARHPDVAGAAVTAGATARGDARLTAHVSIRPGRSVAATDLRRWLRTVLAPHAMPAAFVFLDELPLTPHGKLATDRLAEPEAPWESGRAVPDLASETEELLAGLWADALERDVTRHEAFLELGGDSLTAAVIAAGVHDTLGVDIDLRVFLADPTVATLAALIDQRRGSIATEDPPRLRRTGRTAPLSFTQERIWAQRPERGSDAGRHVIVPYRIRGPLEVEALRRSVELIVGRHEILRTTFVELEGRPVAVVRAPEPFQLAVDDLRGEPDPHARAAEIVDAGLFEPFDLEQGPLLRLRLLRLGGEEYQLIRASHHLIHDAATWAVFFAELAVVYPALREGRRSPLPDEPPLQYIDYTIWERTTLRRDSPGYRGEVAWWQRRFDPTPATLRLPFTRAEPDEEATGVGVIRWGIRSDQSEALDRIGRAARATYFMTRVAAFAALLALETGVEDFVIGTAVSMRTRVELHDMVGPFTNVRLLRVRLSGEPTFRSLVTEVRRAVIDLSAHATIPWDHLKQELVAREVKLPTVTASFSSWSGPGAMRFGELELESLPRQCGATPVFRLGVNRRYEADRCWVEFEPRLHDRAGVESFLGRLLDLIGAVGAEPDRSLRDLHSAARLI